MMSAQARPLFGIYALCALDVRFIAEGVETEEIKDFVTRLGFDAAQGYAIGKPEPETRIK